MMAMSPSRMVAAADVEDASFDVGLKFKISSSPDKRVSDSESLGLVF